MFVIGGSVVVVKMVVVEIIGSLSLIELLNRSKVFLALNSSPLFLDGQQFL